MNSDAVVIGLQCCCFFGVTTIVDCQGIDRSTRIWDVRTGNCEMKFETRDAEVNAVKFFPGGEEVAAAGNDGIVSWGSGGRMDGGKGERGGVERGGGGGRWRRRDRNEEGRRVVRRETNR